MHRFVAVALALACACARPSTPSAPAAAKAAPVAPSPPARTDEAGEVEIRLEPILIETEISSGGAVTSTATDARALFEAGNEALVAGRSGEALGHYQRVLRDFPESRLAVLAMYNAGLALEGQGKLDEAVARYLAIVRREGSGRDTLDAHMRAVAVLSELERFSQAAQLVADFLARPDLSPVDRLEGHARLGYLRVELGEYAAAEGELRQGLEAAGHSEELARGYFAAMCHFYLGEIPRRQFAVVPVRLPESQLEKDLNHKAELVMLARERYNAAIATGHLYWATAAGYQIASMQAELRDSIVLAPIPDHLNKEAAAIYERRVHKEARRFLHRALRVHQQTVELARLYRTATPWSEAARVRVEQIADVLARESAGELVKPRGLGEHSALTAPVSPQGYFPARVDL